MITTISIDLPFVSGASGVEHSRTFTIPVTPFSTMLWKLRIQAPVGTVYSSTTRTGDYRFSFAPALQPEEAPVWSDATVTLQVFRGNVMQASHDHHQSEALNGHKVGLFCNSTEGILRLSVKGVFAAVSVVDEPVNGKVSGSRALAVTFKLELCFLWATLTRRSTALARSQHPHDVRFLFPREGQSLWANSSLLKSTSEYWKTILTSSFAEGARSADLSRNDGPATPVALAFDDSDDEDDAAADSIASEEPPPTCDHPFHTITVTQACFRTYEAVLLWIATGHIKLTTLESSLATTTSPSGQSLLDSQQRNASSLLNADPLPSSVTVSASPKSVYRLAHLLELDGLQLLALANIKTQLRPETVATELFSDVAASYEAFRSVILDYAVEHWSTVKQS